MSVLLRRRLEWCEPAIRAELRRTWLVAEVVLFSNLGSQIDLQQVSDAPLVLLLLAIMAAALAVRLGVTRLMARATALTPGEQLYVTAAHVPKATIQAVFGALPLATFAARGQEALLDEGKTLLVMAALAIVTTAPLGAVVLERWGTRLLSPPGEER